MYSVICILYAVLHYFNPELAFKVKQFDHKKLYEYLM